MISQKARDVMVGVISMIVGVGFGEIRRTFDVPPVASWAVLAFLAALLLWHLRNQSPYRTHEKTLHLDSR